MQLELPRRRANVTSLSLSLDARLARIATLCGVTAGVFAVYLTTLAPSVMWYDMGEFATASASLGIAHNTGYPLLILLGKLFTFLPFGDEAYRVNLMSAVFTALAVALVFATVHDLTKDVVASAIAALTLAFASTVWANATWATSYGLNLFFVALITRLMFAWHRDRTPRALIGAALAFGLALCNHRLIALVAPPSLLLLALSWRSVDRRTAALSVAAFALGLAVYLYLPIRGEQEPVLSWARPATWNTYLSMFLNGQTPSDYWRFDLVARLNVIWEYPRYDLTLGGLVVAGIGAGALAVRQRAIAAYIALLFVLDAVVVLSYSIHNVYNYLTPAYAVLAVCIGAGAAWMRMTVRKALSGNLAIAPWVAPFAVYALLLAIPASLLVQNHARVDRSDDYAAHDFARTTLERLPERSVVLTDSWTAPPLWYAQVVEGTRRDVMVSPIFSVRGEDVVAFARAQMADGRPVYVAEGLRVTVGVFEGEFAVQPVVLNGIHTMVTNVLVKPEYRDDMVPLGSLYKLVDAPVPQAPVPWQARDIALGQGTQLMGFAAEGSTVERGAVVRLSYRWRVGDGYAGDLVAVTVFGDGDGDIAQRHGWPVWWQSRPLVAPGGGAREVEESYFSIVPRSIKPGTYSVRVGLVSADSRGATAIDTFQTVGTVRVR